MIVEKLGYNMDTKEAQMDEILLARTAYCKIN